jgi:hypothetical protein
MSVEIDHFRPRARKSELFSPELEKQIQAYKHLVYSMRERFLEQKIFVGRSNDRYFEPRPHYAAFLHLPDHNAVIQILSIGSENERSSVGFFLNIKTSTPYRKGIDIVRLQTVKTEEVIDKEQAAWVSVYTPEQLDRMTELVKEAQKMELKDYDAYVGIEREIPQWWQFN